MGAASTLVTASFGFGWGSWCLFTIAVLNYFFNIFELTFELAHARFIAFIVFQLVRNKCGRMDKTLIAHYHSALCCPHALKIPIGSTKTIVWSSQLAIMHAKEKA